MDFCLSSQSNVDSTGTAGNKYIKKHLSCLLKWDYLAQHRKLKGTFLTFLCFKESFGMNAVGRGALVLGTNYALLTYLQQPSSAQGSSGAEMATAGSCPCWDIPEGQGKGDHSWQQWVSSAMCSYLSRHGVKETHTIDWLIDVRPPSSRGDLV